MSRPAPARDLVGTAVSLVLLALLFGAALIPWWPIYESGAFVLCAALAVVAGLGIGVVGAWRAWPAWAVAVAVASAYVVLGVPAAVPSRTVAGVLPTPAGLVDLLTGTALSWKQLVTVAAPVGSYQTLLVPVFLLTLTGAAVAATIALRTRHPIAAVLPPAVLLVAGVSLGVVHEQFAAPAGLAFLAASVAWLVRDAIAKRRALGGARRVEAALADARRVIGASAILAVALVGAAAVAVAVPMPQRTVIRSELQPPFEPRDLRSPLAGFRTAFAPEVEDRPMLEVTGLPAGAGLRIATLDTYDGVVYSVGGDDGSALSGRFTRLPYRLDQSDAVGEAAKLDVTVLGYDGVWVPGAGLLERIEFHGPRQAALADGFVVNDVTGAAAVRGGLEPGDSYTAWSVVPEPVDDVSALEPGTSVLPPGADAPEELVRRLDEWAPRGGTPGERLAAVVAALHDEGYVSHGRPGEEPSRSGHGLDRLAELAADRPMIGDGEQYAVAAALMAREIGFPARVVVGYLPDTDADADVQTAREPLVFRGGALQAWIEVQEAGGAWVQIDPNPEVREIPERQPDEPNVVSRPQSALPPPEERTPVDDLGADPAPAPDDDDGADDPWLVVLGTIALVLGVLLLAALVLASPFLAVIAAKARRRRIRRRAATPKARIEGAWEELADTAADYGIRVPPGTRAEQAASVGGLDAVVLAGVVDHAVFGPGGPREGDDDRAWASVDELRRRFASDAGPRRSLAAAISLGSLGGYAVSRRGARA
ncbi:transglutaminase-like domain-containing protein [Agromyces sp. G08B096]|uniref:Transglutaminase-like domain-containing protein n=1 Tax=Agromyces sp. G08B096 TaxID=3156399 RepID=A0AAU7W5T6_9MICO